MGRNKVLPSAHGPSQLLLYAAALLFPGIWRPDGEGRERQADEIAVRSRRRRDPGQGLSGGVEGVWENNAEAARDHECQEGFEEGIFRVVFKVRHRCAGGFAQGVGAGLKVEVCPFCLSWTVSGGFFSAYCNRGNTYLRMGRKEFAIADFRRGCDLQNTEACTALQGALSNYSILNPSP